MNISQLRVGMMIIFEGKYYHVIEFSQCIGGLKVKAVNLMTQDKTEITIKESDSFETFYPERTSVSLMSKDGSSYTFFDNETYNTYTVDEKATGIGMELVEESGDCEALIYNGTVLKVDPPIRIKVTVENVTTEGGVKYAVIKGNIKVSVPSYVNAGDIIYIHAATQQFLNLY